VVSFDWMSVLAKSRCSTITSKLCVSVVIISSIWQTMTTSPPAQKLLVDLKRGLTLWWFFRPFPCIHYKWGLRFQSSLTMTSEGLMTSKGTEASAPDVPPDEGVRREPRKGRLPNGYMFIHLLEPPIWFYFYITCIPSYTFISCFRRITGPARRSSKGNWTAEEVKLALWRSGLPSSLIIMLS